MPQFFVTAIEHSVFRWTVEAESEAAIRAGQYELLHADYRDQAAPSSIHEIEEAG